MSGVHKHPTISFRVSDREREMIEAKMIAEAVEQSAIGKSGIKEYIG